MLGLDELWWMVSPQNPLKPVAGMASLEERLERARAVARHASIRVTDIERRLATLYSADTLRALTGRFPGVHFVWIMGADNLTEIPRWRDWTAIFETVPIAIFDRPSYSLRALAGKAARRYWRCRLAPAQARELSATPPAWIYFHQRQHPASGTRIRAGSASACGPAADLRPDRRPRRT
jgi:nicotinate-nucleotide adenylyltransferase